MRPLVLFLCVLILSGCAGAKEAAKGIAGISTRTLEEGLPQAIKQQVNYGYEDCYNKSKKILEKAGSYIYARNKEMLALYISESDTTVVGVFFKGVDNSNTQVSVSSPSLYAKELIAKFLFLELDKLLHPEKYPEEPGDKPGIGG